MFKREMRVARKHIILIGFIHFAGGFGLALLLQYYLAGTVFLPVAVGWLSAAIAVIGHISVFTGGIQKT